MTQSPANGAERTPTAQLAAAPHTKEVPHDTQRSHIAHRRVASRHPPVRVALVVDTANVNIAGKHGRSRKRRIVTHDKRLDYTEVR